MEMKFSVGSAHDRIHRFDWRGHLKRKELKELIRNLALAKELFCSEACIQMGDTACWAAIGLVAAHKGLIVEVRTLARTSIAIEEARSKNRKLGLVGLSIWDNSNFVAGIDLRDVAIVRVHQQAHDEDIVALKADSTSWD